MMSRKKHKKQSEQQKRLRVTDASGWTHIIKGSRGQNHQRYTNLHEDGKSTEAPRDLTVDKVLERFQKYCQNWKESVSFKDFQLILEEDVLASEKCKITRCVCLGLGSFTSEDGREASMYELAFLSTTLEILGSSVSLLTTLSLHLFACREEAQDRRYLPPRPSVQPLRRRSHPITRLHGPQDSRSFRKDFHNHLPFRPTSRIAILRYGAGRCSPLTMYR